MYKIFCGLLTAALFVACQSDDDKPLAFVTDVVMPSVAEPFTPGDEVTVSAQGLEADDEIWFELRWPLSSVSSLTEGYAKGIRGVITAKSATSISFLAPGHYPAATVSVLLRRGGNMMTLGTIHTTNGLSVPALYGISPADETGRTQIARTEFDAPAFVPLMTLARGRGISCVVGQSGEGWLKGIYSGASVGVDATMRYWCDFGHSALLLTGYYGSSVGALSCADRTLYPDNISATRDYPAPSLYWVLPDGVTADRIARNPFVTSNSYLLLLSVNNGDGTCSPMVLDMRNRQVTLGAAVQAEGLLPFYTIQTVTDDSGATTQHFVGGYVVSKATGGDTEFRLYYNPANDAFEAPFTTFPNKVLSVATRTEGKAQYLYVLSADASGSGNRIDCYDFQTSAWRNVGSGYDYSEIVVM